jgi:hypothetical protein
MQRPGIPANEQPAAGDERSQLRKVELTEWHDAVCCRAESIASFGGNPGSCVPVGRTGAQHDAPRRRSRREPGNQRRECRFRPAPERVAGADVHHDQLVLG